MSCALVVHGGDHAPDGQVGVGEGPHILDGVEELAHPPVGERLALQRDEDRAGRSQAVDGEHTERRRAVDEHHVVLVENGLERPGQDVLAPGPGQQVDLGAGQVDGGRHHGETGNPGHREAHVGHLGAPDEHVVERLIEPVGVEAEGEGEAGLWVEVDQEGPPSQLGHGHPE